MTFTLLLHVAMVLLQATNLESSEVVLVHEAFDGGGEGCNRRGDRNAGDHGLGAHLDFVHHGFGAVLGGVHDPLHFLVVNEVHVSKVVFKRKVKDNCESEDNTDFISASSPSGLLRFGRPREMRNTARVLMPSL